uniref:Uncharacterized protein n=1 Tax=Eutreptiella gymnastica TaxID=73025 RepID=A0A7S4GI30_9EUGL
MWMCSIVGRYPGPHLQPLPLWSSPKGSGPKVRLKTWPILLEGGTDTADSNGSTLQHPNHGCNNQAPETGPGQISELPEVQLPLKSAVLPLDHNTEPTPSHTPPSCPHQCNPPLPHHHLDPMAVGEMPTTLHSPDPTAGP